MQKRFYLLIALLTLVVVNAQSQDLNVSPATVNPEPNKSVSELKLIGTNAPDLTLRDADMHPIVLSKIKTPYLLVLFWDPNCPHCAVLTPRLDSLYNTYLKTIGCEVLGINIGSDKQQWEDFMKQHHLGWLNVWDPDNESDMRKKYDVYANPVMFVLDKNRKIVANVNKIADVKGVLDKLVENDNQQQGSEAQNTNNANSGTDNLPFNLYPNPFKDGFTLYMPGFNNKVTVAVSDIDGRKVFDAMYETVNSTQYIELGNRNLTTGYYIVTASSGSNAYSWKVMKE